MKRDIISEQNNYIKIPVTCVVLEESNGAINTKINDPSDTVQRSYRLTS
jgi:hypothetical protein